jgi:hypothetical protein
MVNVAKTRTKLTVCVVKQGRIVSVFLENSNAFKTQGIAGGTYSYHCDLRVNRK